MGKQTGKLIIKTSRGEFHVDGNIQQIPRDAGLFMHPKTGEIQLIFANVGSDEVVREILDRPGIPDLETEAYANRLKELLGTKPEACICVGAPARTCPQHGTEAK